LDWHGEENRTHHGGFDQAVYAYAREDAQWWESELGIDNCHGRFGENLTTQGLDVTRAVIGERWRIDTGDDIVVVDRPSHGVTISDLFAAKSGERSRMAQILQVPQLSDSWRSWATSIVNKNLL